MGRDRRRLRPNAKTVQNQTSGVHSMPHASKHPFQLDAALPAWGEIELLAFGKEFKRIVVNDFADQGFRQTATSHLEDQIRDRGRLARACIW